MFVNKFNNFENCECGLLTFKGGVAFPVPLIQVNVKATIVDYVSQVEIKQEYVNNEDNPIEIVYLFPVDNNATVCGASAVVGSKEIIGLVKSKSDARDVFEAASKDGHTTFILELNKPDIFEMKLGNLQSKEKAVITINYVAELRLEKDVGKFFLPTTICPRYVPLNDDSETAEKLKSLKYTSAPIPLTVSVEWMSSNKAIAFLSTSHQVHCNIADKPSTEGYFVNTAAHSEKIEMDRDFVLTLKQEIGQPQCIMEVHQDGSVATMVTFVPDIKADDQKVEIIFVIDQSGSMDGVAIDQARSSLKLFLHSLPMDCYFNIIGFGTSYNSLFPSSQKYSQESLNEALGYANKMRANMGGTEIMAPLSWMYDQKLIDNYLRQAIILTDGMVSNTEEVHDLVRKHNSSCRLFALGLGPSVSIQLVQGLSEAGLGSYRLVTHSNELDRAVQSQLQHALQPAYYDISISWDGIQHPDESSLLAELESSLVEGNIPKTDKPKVSPISQVPFKIPPIFNQSRVIIFFMYNKNELQPTGFNILAKYHSGQYEKRISLASVKTIQTSLIHKLATKKLIQELLDGTSYLRMTMLTPDPNFVKDQVINLGIKHGIASKYTSFVAVDNSSKSVENVYMVHSREIPHQAPWGKPTLFSNCPTPFAAGFGSFHTAKRLSGGGGVAANKASFLGAVTDSLEVNSMPEAINSQNSTPKSATLMESLVSLQKFDGQFQYHEKLLEILDCDENTWNTKLKEMKTSIDYWVTAVISAIFHTNLKHLQEEWHLVNKKALKWLQSKDSHFAVLLPAAEKWVSEMLEAKEAKNKV